MPRDGRTRATEGHQRLYDSLLDAIGETPTVPINSLGTNMATIYLKAEFFKAGA